MKNIFSMLSLSAITIVLFFLFPCTNARADDANQTRLEQNELLAAIPAAMAKMQLGWDSGSVKCNREPTCLFNATNGDECSVDYDTNGRTVAHLIEVECWRRIGSRGEKIVRIHRSRSMIAETIRYYKVTDQIKRGPKSDYYCNPIFRLDGLCE